MTALVFVDTNVLVYARDPRDPAKHARAEDWIRMLWNEQRGRTSVQVLNEYYDVVTRKFLKPVRRDDAWDDVQRFFAWTPQSINSEVLINARTIEERHRLSWWDCLVVAAAQVQGCVLLLTEDMQDGADYGGVSVRSPFNLGIAEERSAYTAFPKLASRHRGRGRPRRHPKPAAAG
jgi:predicted nucleic acid-binding protein